MEKSQLPSAIHIGTAIMIQQVDFGKLAELILANSSEAATYLAIADGVPLLTSQAVFNRDMAEVKRLRLERDISNCERKADFDMIHLGSSHTSRKVKSNSRHHLNRLAKLWCVRHPKYVLKGIATENGVVSSPSGMIEELKKAWKPVFGMAGQPSPFTQMVLDKGAVPVDFRGIRTPNSELYRRVLSRAPHTAPGKDGIPFSAWANCGPAGPLSLYQYGSHLAAGSSPHAEFNESIMHFIPKEVDEQSRSSGHIVCEAPATRPFSLKNTDNKTIASVYNEALTPILAKQSFWTQRGFTKGRQLIQNVLDLDTFSRLAALRPELKPILVLFDFASAFPSVFHCWLMAVMVHCGAPQGLRNIVQALYTANNAFVQTESGYVFLFSILSGVLQGCPFSGAIFSMCVEPFVRRIYAMVDAVSLGASRICADDIGIVLNRLSAFVRLPPIFKAAQLVAGLTLKPKKCVIIPLEGSFSETLQDAIKNWLHEKVPAWAFFSIRLAGKYLGFMIGPGAKDQSWVEPLRKWKLRAKEISTSGMPTAAAITAYNSKAITLLSYVAQLEPPPASIGAKEMHTVNSLLRVPPQTFSRAAAFNLEHYGGVQILCINAFADICMMRTALKTLSGFESTFNMLRERWSVEAPLGVAFRGDLIGYTHPPFFHPPLVFNLHLAVRKLNTCPGLAKAGRAAFHQLGESKGGYRATPADLYSSVLKMHFHLPALPALTKERLTKLFPDVQWGRCAFDTYFELLKQAKGFRAMASIKSVLGAWCTSSRMHEPNILPCLFGCPCPAVDTFTHYVQCPCLWWEVHIFLISHNLVDLAFKIHFVGTSDQALFFKLGLEAECYDDFLPIALAFGLYHALKLHSKAEVLRHLESLDFSGLRGLCLRHLHAIFSAHLRGRNCTFAIPSES